ncbi:hypothetical protein K488DRAFT_75041 [Vararia minispora EC-137]|uniref:Uncharacterized protein n=1 Tax=Vararia minispora EC-137 TaxID=1314806 RepID=A0ACB8Q565_9AGAM|nr:hypothetical protein K488DRAFT_75041 [Vararia minispora EC-137]
MSFSIFFWLTQLTACNPAMLKDTVLAYMLARGVSFVPVTFQAAWKKSGIDIDQDGMTMCIPDTFTTADFALSISTSVEVKFPESFPAWDLDTEDVAEQSEWAVVSDVLEPPQLVSALPEGDREGDQETDSDADE